MSFVDEIKSFCSDGLSPRVVLFGRSGAYFEGVICIIEVKSDLVLLKTKGGKIKIEGKNFIIKKYCGGDVAVNGAIASLEML